MPDSKQPQISVDTVVADVKACAAMPVGSIVCSASSIMTGGSTAKGFTLYIREESKEIKKLPRKPKIDVRFAATQAGSIMPVIAMAKINTSHYRGWLDYHALGNRGKVAAHAIDTDTNIIIVMVGDSGSKEQIFTLTVKPKLKEDFKPILQTLEAMKSWQPFMFETMQNQVESSLPANKEFWRKMEGR